MMIWTVVTWLIAVHNLSEGYSSLEQSYCLHLKVDGRCNHQISPKRQNHLLYYTVSRPKSLQPNH